MSGARITAAAHGLAVCHVCTRVTAVAEGHCPRCGAPLHLRKPRSLERTAAWLITAVILYVPANVLPIMETLSFGHSEQNTILSGVIALIEHGSIGIAVVIFVASVMIPLAKLFALTWLVISVARADTASAVARTRLYRVTEFVGRWSMVDVFVVAVLVALVHLGNLVSIYPGPGALAFGGVVIATMLAAHAFDPRLIWDHVGDGP